MLESSQFRKGNKGKTPVVRRSSNGGISPIMSSQTGSPKSNGMKKGGFGGFSTFFKKGSDGASPIVKKK